MKDNLELLADARKGIDLEHIQSFYSFFAGALSGHVPQEVWTSCLETAKQCVEGMTCTTQK